LLESINLEKPFLNESVNSVINQKNTERVIITGSKNIMSNDEIVINNDLSGKALGIAYQVYEGMGSAKTSNLSMSINNLSVSDKRNLARLGLRLGVETIYLPNLLKPSSISLRALLWSVYNNSFPELGPPPDGRVSVVVGPDINYDYYRAIGFVPLGNLALRADIAERLSALIRVEARTGKFKINDTMLSISGSTKIQMEGILCDLGYIKVSEEPSTLVDQIPINFFERQKKKSQKTNKTVNLRLQKKQNFKMSKKNNLKNKVQEKPVDPLSPFAILKSIKIK
jgi:hypothetical protein